MNGGNHSVFAFSVSGDLSGPSYILDSTLPVFNDLLQIFHVKIHINLYAKNVSFNTECL